MLKRIFIGIIFLLIPLFSQQPILSHRIGTFSNAESFSISRNQFIYVTDSKTNEVYKLDLEGTVQKFIGGYGWSESAFDFPVDVFATTLNVYVTDKNNDRVQFFDSDLNYISQFGSDKSENNQFEFRYPSSAVVSPLGDLFILDSDNSRIIKFDLNGNFSLEIGNYDAGRFAFNNPTKFDISGDLRLFVLDENEIKIFDQFGGGLSKLKIDEGARNIQITDYIVCISYINKILIFDLENTSAENIEIDLDEESPIKDSFVSKEHLFVLTEHYISIYNFPKQ